MPIRIAAAGDRALLITIPGASAGQLRAAAESLRHLGGMLASIVGHESVYAIGTRDVEAARRAVESSNAANVGDAAHHRVEVSFRDGYGLDLPEFLARVGVSRDEFLRRVARVRLTVRYLGFRGGFAYLEGWPAEWAMPRRPTSRNRVPGGSFAIAGAMAGFYPIDSPGGWNILGRTAAALPFAPADQIEIVPTLDEIAVPPTPRPEAGMEQFGAVLWPGQLTSVVHAPDWSRLDRGLPEGGPFDPQAAAMANETVGNASDAPLLECVLVGPKLRLSRPAAFCDGELQVRIFPPGVVEIGRIRGMRGYLAIEESAASPGVRRAGGGRTDEDRKTIHAIAGPHEAPAFPPEWEVTPQLDRVGVRLRPLQAVEEQPPADLPSLGTQFGTLQWHPDGSLLALGPDHPITGGYLQPATVAWSERWKLAQLAPGDHVRLIVSR